MSNYSTDPQYLSSKEAGKLLGYTHDYISKLCREGKMSGKQQGRAWYVTKVEVTDFKTRHQAELAQKKAKLSTSFSKMRSDHDSVRTLDTPIQTQAKEAIKEVKKEDFVQAPEQEMTQNSSSTNQLRFTLPKKLTAAGVLAFALLFSSFLSAPVSNSPVAQNTPDIKVSQTASIQTGTEQIKNSQSQNTKANSTLVSNLDTGIASVIGAQSELFLQTANTYAFVQYLSDGYWQLAQSTTFLCAGFYRFLDTVSDGYLTFYMLQGQAVYYSFATINQIGAGALSTYEMTGQAVWIGTQNTLNVYSSIFGFQNSTYIVRNKAIEFTANVSEGFDFYSQKAPQALASALWLTIGEGLVQVGSNIQSNSAYISNGFTGMAQNTTALISESFSLEFFGPRDSVRKVEIK